MNPPDPQPEYEPGDTVKRKADGQRMTVDEVYPPMYVYRFKCSWRDATGAKSGLYRATDLEPDGGK